jgi:hypothetical protein
MLTAGNGWNRALEEWMLQRSEQFGWRPGRLQAVRVVNPSGWHANIACTVGDGVSRVHVKLTRAHAGLRRAFELRNRLTSRYHAPPILAWIDLGDLVGVAMPSIEAEPATELLIPDLISVTRLLHEDRELAAALPDGPRTLRQAFLDLWIERFVSDLGELEAGRKIPPFVSAETFEWMRAETSRLARMASSTAFDASTVSPVHGDLHLGNVLVEPEGRWWLIDWDDLHRGDPAADLAILLSPLIERAHSVDHFLGEQDDAFGERFALCARAQILDGVIDSLTDWADADALPVSRDAVRCGKRTTHEHALRMYRERYTH